MGWAAGHIDLLKEGMTVSFRPRGGSMAPKINSGDLVTVVPAAIDDVKKGDIVLCKVRGREYLHLVKARREKSVLIGNNKGRTNGWTSAVFGKVTQVVGQA